MDAQAPPGASKNLRTRALAFGLVALFLLLVGLQTTLVHGQQRAAQDAREWVEHTYLVMQTISGLQKAIDESKEAELGYVLTGRKDCIATYEEFSGHHLPGTVPPADKTLPLSALFAQLRELTKDNAAQQEVLGKLAPLLRDELKFMDRQIEEKEGGSSVARLEAAENANPQASLKRVDALLAEMMAREKALLETRTLDFKDNAARFERYMMTAAGITYGFLLFAMITTLLGASRARYARDKVSYFVKHLPASVAVCDRDMKYLMVSDRWYMDFRLKSRDVLGQSHFDTFPVTPPRWRRILEDCVNKGEASSDEEKIEIKGKPFWLRWDVRPWHEPGGRIGGLIMAAEVITERKEAEEAMKSARAAADAASRAKSEFLASMNHELRTPLTSIRGALGLIDGGALGPVPARIGDMVKRAYANCERLSRLINDILDLEKIEAGKMQIRIAPHAVEPALRQALENLQAYAGKFNVRFQLHEAPRDVEVLADPDRLMQVLANLLSNAAKFSPEGGTVEVRSSFHRGRVRYEVEDHGMGIPEEFRPHIFGKFTQADGRDSRRREGTGLGLAIARHLVEEMGGTIGFTTEEGKGTTFFFELPGYRLQDEKPKTSGEARRVLVCEDEKGSAEYIRFLLGRAGFATDLARTVKEAREWLKTGGYDAVTLDLTLADGNSAGLLRELRSDPATRDLPVVVVSARADDAKHEPSAAALNVADWLVKPFDADRILHAVRAAAIRRGGTLPQILHVEDDRDLTHYVSEALRGKAEVYPAYTVQDAEKALKSRPCDLVILDIGMPDASGLALLELLPTLSPAPPVLILSAQEADADIHRKVAAALVKSRVSEDKVIETILSLLAKNQPSTPVKTSA